MARRKSRSRMRYVYDPRNCARLRIHGPRPPGFIEAKDRAECLRLTGRQFGRYRRRRRR